MNYPTNYVNLEIKKLNEKATIPSYSREGDAGLDLTATEIEHIHSNFNIKIGLAIKIPEGYVGLIFPRSSIAFKDLLLTNSVGVIDSNYTGEITFKFKRTEDTKYADLYSVGDRVGQLIIIPYPKVLIKEVSELPSTNRGTEGFGSSGR